MSASREDRRSEARERALLLLYEADAKGGGDLWIMNADGCDRRQLTFGLDTRWPAVSPDGRYVLFTSKRTGGGEVWRVDADGSSPTRLAERPDFIVIDVSFISLKLVLPAALALARAPASLIALIKPQYETERKHYKGGVIRNAMVHQQICDDIMAFAGSLGCNGMQVFPSSIAGGDGNIEFFLGARRG